MEKKRDEEGTETQLLPVMNIMLLLIPALLLAMEVARMGAIEVRPPLTTRTAGTEDPPPPKPQLRVFIANDGFEIRIGARGSAPPKRIGLSASAALDDRHDYATLEAEAATLLRLGTVDPVVYVDAENDVPMATLVATMDAMRGSRCSLVAAHAGENAPAGCLFHDVVVEPGTRGG